MKLIITPIICLLFVSSLFAQVDIRGSIVNTDNESVPFSHIKLINASDSSFVSGTISSLDGDFLLKSVHYGKYSLIISNVEYKTQLVDLNVTKETNAINIILQSTSNQLEEVLVVSEKPKLTVQNNKLSIDVANSEIATGLNAKQLLSRTPRINIDEQNNNLTIDGLSGVGILINGKETDIPRAVQLQMLSTINAFEIDRIEIIPASNAQFGAEGNAGYINIILKEDFNEGFQLLADITGGIGRGTHLNSNIIGAYKTENFSASLLYSNYYNTQMQFSFNERLNKLASSSVINTSLSERNPIQLNNNLKFAFRYLISKGLEIEGNIYGSKNLWKMDATTTTQIQQFSSTVDSLFVTNINETNLWENLSTGLKLTKSITDELKININGKYLNYLNENPSDYLINKYFNDDLFGETTTISNTKSTPISIYSVASSVEGNHKDRINYNFGVKGISSTFSNDVAIKSNREAFGFTSKTIFDETILAAFLQSNLKLVDKYDINLGVRVESTNSELKDPNQFTGFNRNYTSIFPSISLEREMDKNMNVGVSYSRGIERPTFNDIAPFLLFLDENTLFTGNSNLLPSFANNFKAFWQYLDYNVAVSYSQIENAISRFQFSYEEDTETQIISPLNLESYSVLSVNLLVPLYISDWWNVQTSLLGLHQEVIGKGNSFRKSSFKFTQSHSFKLPLGISMEISGFFDSPRLDGYKKNRQVYGVDVGLSKDFNRAGSITLSIKDIFNSIEYYSTAEIENGNVRVLNGYDFSQRTIMATYSQVFGNRKLRSSKSQQDFTEEEKRIK